MSVGPRSVPTIFEEGQADAWVCWVSPQGGAVWYTLLLFSNFYLSVLWFPLFFGRALRLGEIDVQLSDLDQPCLCARVAGAARLRPWTMSCGTLGSHGEF